MYVRKGARTRTPPQTTRNIADGHRKRRDAQHARAARSFPQGQKMLGRVEPAVHVVLDLHFRRGCTCPSTCNIDTLFHLVLASGSAAPTAAPRPAAVSPSPPQLLSLSLSSRVSFHTGGTRGTRPPRPAELLYSSYAQADETASAPRPVYLKIKTWKRRSTATPRGSGQERHRTRQESERRPMHHQSGAIPVARRSILADSGIRV